MLNQRLEARLLRRKLERVLLNEAPGDPVVPPAPPAPPAALPVDSTPAGGVSSVDNSTAPTNDPGGSGEGVPVAGADGSAVPPTTDPSTGAVTGGGGGAVGVDGTEIPGEEGADATGDVGGGAGDRFAVSGGGGGGGGGGMDSSSEDTIGGEEGEGGGEEGLDGSAETGDPVSAAKDQLVALASEPPSSKNDPLALVKATKGLIQAGFTTKGQVTDLINQLSQEETPRLKELAERLRLFMTITTSRNSPQGTSPMKPPVTATPTKASDTGLSALQEATLKELVSETVTKIISENSSYTAMRKLAIQAQETSLDFEKNIVTLLGIVEPDMLDGTARKVYHQAAEAMKQRMVDAVLTAAQQIARLPKKDDGKQQ